MLKKLKFAACVAAVAIGVPSASWAWSFDFYFNGELPMVAISNDNDYRLACRASYNYDASDLATGAWVSGSSSNAINGHFHNDPVTIFANRTNEYMLTPVPNTWRVSRVYNLRVTCQKSRFQ